MPLLSFYEAFVFDLLLFFLLAEDNDLMMPEVPADEAVTDPIVASGEEPRDSEVDPESPPGMIFFFFFFVFFFFTDTC